MMIKTFLIDILHKMREINQKYREPRIRMTRTVSIILLLLRLYLIFLVGLLIYKFISIL